MRWSGSFFRELLSWMSDSARPCGGSENPSRLAKHEEEDSSTPSPPSGSFSSSLCTASSARPSSGAATVSPSASPASLTGSSSHDECLGTVAEDEMVAGGTLPKEERPVPLPAAAAAIPAAPRIIEVKCGPLHAKMHVELFLCPGIHQQCIELDGEMISPKEFTVRANKDKQKDWKGSIRIGKSNLRSLMEMRSFDFYNHSVFCSAKCQSRNYITPKGAQSDKSETDKDSRRSSKSSIEQLIAMQIAGSSPPNQPQTTLAGYGSLSSETCDSLSQFIHFNHALNYNNNNNNSNNNNNNYGKEELVDVDDSLVHPQSRAAQITPEHINSLLNTQPSTVWTQLAASGLLDDVISLVQTEVDDIRSAAKHPATATSRACESLCRVSLAFGLGEHIAHRMQQRQFKNELTSREESRKRRLEMPSSAVAATGPLHPLDSLKRPCLSYDELLLSSHAASAAHAPIPYEHLLRPPSSAPTGREFASATSAFSFPSVAAAARQIELLVKLVSLCNPSQSVANGMGGAMPPAPQTALLPPQPPPPAGLPPPGLPAPTPSAPLSDHFSLQLTQALLEMEQQH